MCQDNNHGGKRCPSDTSEARRLRRKASTIRNVARVKPERNPGEPIVATGNVRFEELQAKADELRAELYAGPTSPKAQAKHDAKMEKKITAFGVEIAAEADKIAGFDSKVIQQKLDDVAEQLYVDINNKLEKIDAEFDIISDKWYKIAERIEIDDIFIRPSHLAEDQIELLTDEEKKVLQDYKDNRELDNLTRQGFKDIDKKYDELRANIHKEANDKLTQAYQTIIASIRPVGGEATFNTVNSGEAAQIMKETVEAHYPSSWLQAHNEQDGASVTLIETNTRASYNPAVLSETEDDGVPKTIVTAFALSGEPKFINQIQAAFPQSSFVGIESTHWLTNNKVKNIHLYYDEEEIYDPEKHGSYVPSEKTGWEYRTTPESASLPSTQTVSNEQEYVEILTKKRWVRTKFSTKKLSPRLQIFDKESSEQITKDNKDIVDYQKAVAYHEFGHRVEAVLPDNILPRQERAFLMRRAGKTEENYYDNMVNTGMANEYGHDGKFVTKYVGRDYYQNKNYEVFTVGIESIYGGTHGGLVGISDTHSRQDLDHRGFTLGILATL